MNTRITLLSVLFCFCFLLANAAEAPTTSEAPTGQTTSKPNKKKFDGNDKIRINSYAGENRLRTIYLEDEFGEVTEGDIELIVEITEAVLEGQDYSGDYSIDIVSQDDGCLDIVVTDRNFELIDAFVF